jgi:hypothetical protein
MAEPDSTRTDTSEEGFFRHSQATVGNSSVHVVNEAAPKLRPSCSCMAGQNPGRPGVQ